MKIPTRPAGAFMALMLGAVSVWAWQNASEKVGMTTRELDNMIRNALGSGGEGFVPNMSNPVRTAYKALPEAEKVAVVRELIGAAKAILLSDAVMAAQDKSIEGTYGGKNHNLPVKTQDDLYKQYSAKKITKQQLDAEMLKMRAGDAAADVARREASSLRSQIEGDLNSIEYIAKSGMKPMAGMPPNEAVLEKTKAVAAMAKGDPAAFKKAYMALESFKNGGPSEEAAVEQLVKEAQQRIYNEYAPKAKIRKGLEDFLQNAAKVNFAATTVAKGSRMVFADPAMERAPAQVKFLYRLGKAPTAVAVEEAKALLKQL